MKTIDYKNKRASLNSRYSDITVSNKELRPRMVSDLFNGIKSEVDQVTEVIYAPNPVTGLPDGDVSLYLNDKTAPEVKMFIEQKLLQPLPHRAGAPSDDVAMEMIVPSSAQFGAERDYYVAKLDKIVSDYRESLSVDQYVLSQSDNGSEAE